MAKSKERIDARRLRIDGRSIKSIARDVGVSKSSVSLWCQDIQLTNDQVALLKARSGGKGIGPIAARKQKIEERLSRRSRLMKVGMKKFPPIDTRIVVAMGLALYWAEGYKKGRDLRFCNSDPDMIKLYLKWLELVFGVSKDQIKLKVGINIIHKYRINDITNYWLVQTGCSNFDAVSYKKVSNSKIYENLENHFGTLEVRVRKSTNMFYCLEGMLEKLKLGLGGI